MRWSDAAFVAAAMTLWGLAVAWVASRHAWQSGFDDWDHIPAAVQWAQGWQLSQDSELLRVPLWPMLLGTFFHVFGAEAGLPILQAAVVLGTLVLYVAYAAPLRGRLHPAWVYLPAAAFVLSPQALLYSRHAVNEPLVGLLVGAVLLATRSASRSRAWIAGVLCGAAAMTKIVCAALAVPALGMLLRKQSAGGRARATAWFLAGTLLVVAPVASLHVAQRGWVLIDTTTAYNLSGYSQEQWVQLGDHRERHRAGMEEFRRTLSRDPAGYLAGFLQRLSHWVVRPASGDFELYYRDYPHRLLRTVDAIVFWSLALLAILGTDRRTAWIWLFVGAIAVGCTFPVQVPESPKVTLLYLFLPLAPFGLARWSGNGLKVGRGDR